MELLNGSTIGSPNYLTDEQIAKFEIQIPYLLPEMETVEHPSDEREIREQIKKIVHHGCDRGLMITGLYLTVAGFARVPPKANYPPSGHPTGYGSNWNIGHILHESPVIQIGFQENLINNFQDILTMLPSKDQDTIRYVQDLLCTYSDRSYQ